MFNVLNFVYNCSFFARSCVAVLALAIVTSGDAQATDNEPPPNVPLPTLGGKQVWRDGFVHAGWRIQESVLTGHFRLLDERNVRHAWGTYAQCKEVFNRLRAKKGLSPPSDHLVLLVHGILRSPSSFSRMAPALRAAGFDAVAISYPSTRDTIAGHAAGLGRLLERAEGSTKVSFVTHSMGGLVVRQLLADGGGWRSRLSLGRLVMLAPPSQGSAIARLMKDVPAYQWIYGPAGQELVPRTLDLPAPTVLPFLIIAGGKNDGEGFNPLLPGDDDGTVAVDEARLVGAEGLLLVPELHSIIPNDGRTITLTRRFLLTGQFAE